MKTKTTTKTLKAGRLLRLHERWEKVDWWENDAGIARDLGVSREAVRQQRAKRGEGKSPRWHMVNGGLKDEIDRLGSGIHEMTAREISQKTGYDIAYVKSLLKEMKVSYRWEDGRVSRRKYAWDKIAVTEWESLSNKEIGKRVGVKNLSIVSGRRARERARWAKFLAKTNA